MTVISESQIKAKPAEIKALFEKDSIRGKVALTDLKNLKAKDYDDIAFGIGNGSLTY
jgi:hypothetical protein